MAGKPSPKGKKKSTAKGGTLKKVSKGVGDKVKGGSLFVGVSTKTAMFRVVPQPLGDTKLDRLGSGGALFEDKITFDKG